MLRQTLAHFSYADQPVKLVGYRDVDGPWDWFEVLTDPGNICLTPEHPIYTESDQLPLVAQVIEHLHRHAR